MPFTLPDHIDAVMGSLRELGFRAERVRVGYEFQRGANEMLTVERPRRA